MPPDDVGKNELPSPKNQNPSPKPPKQCVKCPSLDAHFFGLDPLKAVYCRECFARAVRHKFSMALGKHRVFRNDGGSGDAPEPVLLLWNGSPGAHLLTEFVHRAINDENEHRRPHIEPRILLFSTDSHIIDTANLISHGWPVYFAHECFILGEKNLEPPFLNESEVKTKMRDIVSFMDTLAEVFPEENSIDAYERLLAPLKRKSPSVFNELRRLLRHLLVARVAAGLGIRRVLTAEYAEQLAAAALDAISFGRGASVASLTGVVDRRPLPGGVQFVRPLREICAREIRLLNDIHRDEEAEAMDEEDRHLLYPEKETGRGENGDGSHEQAATGTQALTVALLSDLQTGGFPATVPTVLSMCAKLVDGGGGCPSPKNKRNQPKNAEEESGERSNVCPLCFSSSSTFSAGEKDVENNGSFFCSPCTGLLRELEEASPGGAETLRRQILGLKE